jgi:hypothetical protein
MFSLAKLSWEFGSIAQSLLELDNPDFLVFGSKALQSSPSLSSREYAKEHVELNSKDNLCFDRHSNADESSLGVAAVMLGQTDDRYKNAARRQLETILKMNPRDSNSAISHRKESVEYW